ncbi:MAG: hypothetical protein V1778_02005 [bacterium]
MPERITSPEISPTLPPSAERLPSTEAAPHPSEEHRGESIAENAPTTPQTVRPAVMAPTQPRDRFLREVEEILTTDLGDTYAGMDPLSQREFKEEGERAAHQIRGLLSETRLRIHKILKILTSWLRMIPGVSRLFVEQEAKITTDRLLALRRRERGETEGHQR